MAHLAWAGTGHTLPVIGRAAGSGRVGEAMGAERIGAGTKKRGRGGLGEETLPYRLFEASTK